MVEKKTIQVNKEYFSLNGRFGGKKSRKKENTRKKREKPKTIQSSKKMRKEFLKKIRDYQKRKADEIKSGGQKADNSNEENEFENEFSNSLGFLSNMMEAAKKENHQKTEKIYKEKEKENRPSVDVLLEMPTVLKPATDSKSYSNSNNSNKSSNHIIIDEKNNTKIESVQAPPYSSLKNGSRPTYREWIKTQKRRKDKNNTISIANPPPEKAETERSKRLKAYKKKNATQSKIPRMIKTKKTTKTFKHKLGKNTDSKKVSILIKGTTTRKKIAGERATLNRTSIHEIKKYLRERNMIKSGSTAPADVLRKMYEQCILAGDISNQNGGVLVHNYLNN
ncbi:MAG: hypothetical protein CMI79_01240 [Candidatus Pelagibacter sp.]|nr:hypothetical protein [Candidatus Pelagibacter sp.]